MHINFNNYDKKRLLQYLDSQKIDLCWLLSWEELHSINKNYQLLSVDDIYDAYKNFPSRIIPMYAPDPRDKNATNKLKNYVEKGFKGCGELKVSLNWDSKYLNDYLKVINNLKIPLLFHMESNKVSYIQSNHSLNQYYLVALLNEKTITSKIARILYETISVFNKSLKELKYNFPGYLLDFNMLEHRLIEYPNIKFIGHGPLFWQGMSKNFLKEESFCNQPILQEGVIVELLRKYSNLYCDISGMSGYNALTRDLEYSKQFLLEFSNKVLFGTDNFPYEKLGYKKHKEIIDSFNLSKNDYKLIYAQNALDIIGM